MAAAAGVSSFRTIAACDSGICTSPKQADNVISVEHPCIQCGAEVEDGRPFCPNCHAPQIRVPVRPPTAPATEPLPPGTPEDVQPPAEPVIYAAPGGVRWQGTADKLMWRPAIGSALIAGMLAAVGTSIPIVPLAMLCMFAAGGLAVTIYRWRSGMSRVTASMGAKLGVMAGGWGFGLLAVLSVVQLFSSSRLAELRKVIEEKVQEMIASNPDPQMRQGFEQFHAYLATDHGLIITVLAGMAIVGAFFLLFSALGGVLGAMLFGREGGHRRPL
jgi:hypothetical protein